MINKGISFGDIHSYYDLNLILSASETPPAKPNTTYVTVPGADGTIDLTEANGGVTYADRDLKFTFAIIPDAFRSFEEIRTEVANRVSGKLLKITQDKDEGYYFLGRCTLDSYKIDKNHHTIVVKVKASPYKFKQDITKKTVELTDTATTVKLANGRKSVVPLITCTDDETIITFKDATFRLSAGTHKILDIQFKEGNNEVTVSGSGTVTFEYQEGEL